MTLCGYKENAQECMQFAEWHLVAGSADCEEMVELSLCGEHQAMVAGVTNLPYTIQDSHGHRMDEVVIGSLRDGVSVKFTNDTMHLCGTCGKSYREAAAVRGCELMHAAETLIPSSLSCRCSVCQTTYGNMLEAAACAARDAQAMRAAVPGWSRECRECKRVFMDMKSTGNYCQACVEEKTYRKGS